MSTTNNLSEDPYPAKIFRQMGLAYTIGLGLGGGLTVYNKKPISLAFKTAEIFIKWTALASSTDTFIYYARERKEDSINPISASMIATSFYNYQKPFGVIAKRSVYSGIAAASFYGLGLYLERSPHFKPN